MQRSTAKLKQGVGCILDTRYGHKVTCDYTQSILGLPTAHSASKACRRQRRKASRITAALPENTSSNTMYYPCAGLHMLEPPPNHWRRTHAMYKRRCCAGPTCGPLRDSRFVVGSESEPHIDVPGINTPFVRFFRYCNGVCAELHLSTRKPKSTTDRQLHPFSMNFP